MKRMKLELQIDGKKKVFRPKNSITIDVVNRSLELEQVLLKSSDPFEKIQACIPYICAVFGHKFTAQDLERNIEFTDILPLTKEVIFYVTAYAKLQLPTEDPKGQVVPFDLHRKRN
ncbi:phage tail assembly chaperone G [Sporosarcina sp. FSL W7-1283]|uniref:phage tail assembly chaperone G n=1 Tax=Sporosarcina sp. FSL W7-1283 TaxID=2921560 RepID=UPI0030FB070F